MQLVIQFVKTHPLAKLPSAQKPGDIGFDLSCVEQFYLAPHETKAVDTGLRLASMPSEFAGSSVFLKVESRSGLSISGVFVVGGIIDPTYRGEIKVILHNSSGHSVRLFEAGSRIAQAVIYHAVSHPPVVFESVDTVTETVRGTSGLGSTGL